MKNSAKKALQVVLILAIPIVLVFLINMALNGLIYRSNETCRGQSFASVEAAVAGMESAVDSDDTSLDISPPYKLLASFDYDEFTVVMYSYEEASEDECAVKMLRKNDGGTLSFVGGFTQFHFSAPAGSNPEYCYYTNVKTSGGMKTVSFLYLPVDSASDLYVDGNAAEKIKLSIDGEEFFVCAAMSEKDTFIKNILVPVNSRHPIVIKQMV